MGRKSEDAGFVCVCCGAAVAPLGRGSYRNHCPRCLRSLHVDVSPGDRANECGGVMEPVGVVYHTMKGWQIDHKCARCGCSGRNVVAPDDDREAVYKLMREQK